MAQRFYKLTRSGEDNAPPGILKAAGNWGEVAKALRAYRQAGYEVVRVDAEEAARIRAAQRRADERAAKENK